MGAFCTATEDTVCLPCPKDHFTQFWNYLPKCLFCANFCDENEIVKEECSPVRNRVCECKEGYYRLGDFCVKNTRCPTGFGAKQIGTAHGNTECEKCAPGTFSAEVSAYAQCVNHTECARVVLKGTNWHDNICSNCTDLMHGGGAALLREVLPTFFEHSKQKLRKLRRFVRLLDVRRAENVHPARHVVLAHVNDWIKTAHEHQLANLPEILRQSNLDSDAEKIDRMLKQIQKAMTFC
ncbi:tumor necrosis factor receptor superfamily member 11B-like [Brachyhypopomus gauderio]|uniref:tumor necrosis factor receptor superfamily member 11B-like n=1 Tax=Brachyhypopomus gauderio TaxID=698409 RepID=UPI00404322CA